LKKDVKKVNKKSLEIRTATMQDLDDILKVEALAWPEGLRATKEMFVSRIRVFPEGQFVCLVNGDMEGICCTQRMDYDFSKPLSSWIGVTDCGFIKGTHDLNGEYLYGVNLSVVSNMAMFKVADKLLDACEEYIVKNNLRGGILGARIPRYHKHVEEFPNPWDYVNKKIGSRYRDPEIQFYSRHKLNPLCILPSYFHDPDSLHNGVLLLFKNSERGD